MIELACRRAITATRQTRTLALVVLLSLIWMAFGVLSLVDPFPFQFLGVICNVVGFWMIFVLAVGQRDQERHHDRVLNAISEHAAATRAHLKHHVNDALEIHRRDVRDHIETASAAIINELSAVKRKKAPVKRAKTLTRIRR